MNGGGNGSREVADGQAAVRLPPALEAAGASGFAIGREPLRREVRKSHQRERILAAATEVFAERGYYTAVDQILLASRASRVTFYSLFDAAGTCFFVVCDRALAAARARLAAAIPAQAPWPEQVAAALSALLEAIAADPNGARIVLIHTQAAGQAGLARHRQLLEESARLLRGGRRVSPFADELPENLERVIVAGVAWLLQQRLATTGHADLSGLLPDLERIVLGPYLGEDRVREGSAPSGDFDAKAGAVAAGTPLYPALPGIASDG